MMMNVTMVKRKKQRNLKRKLQKQKVTEVLKTIKISVEKVAIEFCCLKDEMRSVCELIPERTVQRAETNGVLTQNANLKQKNGSLF